MASMMFDPDPPLRYPDYKSTILRAPARPPVPLPVATAQAAGPKFSPSLLTVRDADLTRQSTGKPMGQRIIVAGRLLDTDARPIRDSLVEIWQCNAAGRYAHPADQHDAPLDPHFRGAGRILTDEEGWFRFVTIQPGAYPWKNHFNAWRPAHIHFSLFGSCYAQRLVTQMYFPGDPLLEHDPIYHSVPAEGRDRLISSFDLSLTQEGIALGYRFDIVLGGRTPTPLGL
jgi:protocatechuate 3,4-dioxygenase, beta subunit